MPTSTLGVIVGNRDFFPDQLVTEARRDVERLFAELDIDAVMPGESDTKLGSVETWVHAQRCAELFRANRDRIAGVLVVLPNFGDEKGVADTLKLAELNVPVLVQAYPDDLNQLGVERRRDAFCGKISVCNNLRQYGIPFSLTSLHTVPLNSEEFRADCAIFWTCAAWCADYGAHAWEPWERGRMPSTPLVTAKSCYKRRESVSPLWIYRIYSAARRNLGRTTRACVARSSRLRLTPMHRPYLRPR